MKNNDERPTTNGSVEPASRLSRILVIGLGNPILGDDGAGWRVAAEVQAQLASQAESIDVDFASVGGLSLMERMLGFRHVILVDTMQSVAGSEGSVRVYALADLPNPADGHTSSSHDASLITALRTAEIMGAAIPARVEIVAIEARASMDFSEELTPRIAAAIPLATRKVIELLRETAP